MIKLFTDTSANLPVSITKEYDIEVVPFSYTVNGKEIPYSADTDFNGRAFYEAMRAGADVKTSMVSMTDFCEAFEPWVEKGNAVIYVGMSGGISGTANAAKLAAEELLEQYPSAKIATIDTYAASLGEGMLVIEAAKMIERGDPFLKVVKSIELLRKNMCQFFTVDDLAYLRKGGRISGAAAVVGTMLNIKPMLRGDETGKIVAVLKKKDRVVLEMQDIPQEKLAARLGKKTIKKSAANPKGGLVDRAVSVHVSNVRKKD